MANITKRIKKDGAVVYGIKVHRYEDPKTKKQLTPFSTTWTPDPKWSELKTQKELNKFVVQYEEDCRNGRISANHTTFYDYAKYVIHTKELNGLKHNTVIDYTHMLERINEKIGFLKLDKIYPATLNKLYSWLSENEFNGRILSAKTVRGYHAFISSVYDFALKEGAATDNPAAKASPPKLQKASVNYLELDTVTALLDALKKEPLKWEVLINVMLLSGARRGEVLGLKWKKIDFNKGIITIDTSLLQSKERGIYESTTKTNQIRSVTLPAETIKLLKRWRAEQAKERLINGDRWIDHDYVFTGDAGRPLHPDSVNTYLIKMCKRHGLPHINPHALRHTHGSTLCYYGADIAAVSKRLGHAQINTTLNFYTHAMQEADARAAQIAEQAMYKSIQDRRKNG